MDTSLVVFFVVTVLWIFSVCLHEFGHAWVAYRGGDYTVAEKGYLTMNPLRYTHPLFSILMPVVFMALGGIGLPGGAVYIDRSLLRSRGWDTAVSLAGPAMDVILVLLIGLAFKSGLIPPDSSKVVTISMAFLLRLEIYAVLLNLLPVPPLDGFQALAPWMRPETRERLYGLSNIGPFVLFLALWYVKPFGQAVAAVVDSICNLMGVDSYWAYLGYRAFRFWEH